MERSNLMDLNYSRIPHISKYYLQIRSFLTINNSRMINPLYRTDTNIILKNYTYEILSGNDCDRPYVSSLTENREWDIDIGIVRSYDLNADAVLINHLIEDNT